MSFHEKYSQRGFTSTTRERVVGCEKSRLFPRSAWEQMGLTLRVSFVVGHGSGEKNRRNAERRPAAGGAFPRGAWERDVDVIATWLLAVVLIRPGS